MPLVNLSRSGALALSPFAIPPREPVRLRLEGYESGGWHGAVVVRCAPVGPLRQLHLAFRRPFPAGPLRAATGRGPGPAPPGERPGLYDRLRLLPLRPGLLLAAPAPRGPRAAPRIRTGSGTSDYLELP